MWTSRGSAIPCSRSSSSGRWFRLDPDIVTFQGASFTASAAPAGRRRCTWAFSQPTREPTTAVIPTELVKAEADTPQFPRRGLARQSVLGDKIWPSARRSIEMSEAWASSARGAVKGSDSPTSAHRQEGSRLQVGPLLAPVPNCVGLAPSGVSRPVLRSDPLVKQALRPNRLALPDGRWRKHSLRTPRVV
jgi:hypothetical protein